MKAPTDIRSIARSHTVAAIHVLVGVMNEKKAGPAARVSAAVALLDRGWGKPAQAITGEGGGPLVTMIERIIVDVHSQDRDK